MIKNSRYKNKNSILLESKKLRAEFTPEPGGKMVSLLNKETGYEFMVQRNGEIYSDQPFNGSYVEGECSGFDDMFPTIDECNYQHDPWKNIKMADHGEVWSLPWSYKLNNNSLLLSVEGVRFPYILEKKIYFSDQKTLRLDYTLKNTSGFDFCFLWAAHLMLNMEEGTYLQLPEDCKEAISILSNGSRKFGDIIEWPWLKDKDGKSYRGDISRSPTASGFEKYYFKNKLQEGFCKLIYPDKRNKLKITFPADTVPYLGILMNENGWDNLYNIFIEPCTVAFDRPDVAEKHGQVSKIGPFGTYKWFLQLTV